LGTGWVVRSHHIEYLRPTFAGEPLIVRTWVAGFRKVTSLRRYQIIRVADERVLAKAATDWAFVNYRTGQPARVPPEIIGSFELVPDLES
jgi:acyl-CoA thioester hydrolase